LLFISPKEKCQHHKRNFFLSSTETFTLIGKYVDTLNTISIPELTKHLHHLQSCYNKDSKI